MAELNLLQGKFTGKLGEVTGTTWKGKAIIRASPFSKAPPTASQTACLRSFEALNRISSAIYKIGWSYLGLSDKNIHRHNAVASWLKPAVRNHTFEPSNISEIIKKSDNVRLLAFTYNKSTDETFIKLELSSGFVPVSGSKLFIIVFDDLGNVHYSFLSDVENFTTRLFFEFFEHPTLSLIAFISEPKIKGFNIYNFIYRRGQDIL